jgi:hypothetical protein
MKTLGGGYIVRVRHYLDDNSSSLIFSNTFSITFLEYPDNNYCSKKNNRKEES